MSEDDPILTPAEVAALFHVSPKTVQRWAVRGWLKCFRTIGGHRRFYTSAVKEAVRNRQHT